MISGGCSAGICRNLPKVVRNGKRYCSVHDPQVIAERRATHCKTLSEIDRILAVRAATWPKMLDLLERAPLFGGDMPGPSRRTPTTTFSQAYRAWQAERNRMLEEVTGMTKGERDAVER